MKTVLIIGVTGNIGQNLRAHLEATGEYALRLLCLNSGNNPAVRTADFSTWVRDVGLRKFSDRLAGAPLVMRGGSGANGGRA
jgi:nucleoside-diphosphate-sugar epimerase